MCNYVKCAFCSKVKLGLFMAWQRGSVRETGHVCYGCEDETCSLMALGRSRVRWLESLEGCK